VERLGDSHQFAGSPRVARTAWQQAPTILTDLDHPDAALVRAKLALNPPLHTEAPPDLSHLTLARQEIA
jgi:hypothetical protein